MQLKDRRCRSSAARKRKQWVRAYSTEVTYMSSTSVDYRWIRVDNAFTINVLQRQHELAIVLRRLICAFLTDALHAQLGAA